MGVLPKYNNFLDINLPGFIVILSICTKQHPRAYLLALEDAEEAVPQK
jgi:hypothetical protein